MSNVPPVRKEVLVAKTPEREFRVFTDVIDRWCPREHHIGSSPLAREVLEPGVGGRWYGVSQDGTECEVGKVLRWEPPARLVLAWQIGADWKHDDALLTEVEVRFVALGPALTRVELEHRLLDRYGAAAEGLRGAFDSEGGWTGILRSFAERARQG